MKAAREHNILAVYNLRDKAGRDILAGMMEAMPDNDEWHLYVLQPGPHFTVRDVRGENGTRYDGFIVTMPGTPEAMHELARSSVPTVLVCIPNRETAARTTSVSSVWTDNADIARKAAEHLLSRGTYKSAGFVHELSYKFYSYEREIAFRKKMKEAGLASCAFPPDNDFSDYQHRLRIWLRSLPKPAAIMAVSDMRAADVILACREETIPVPEQVAVVGVDNDHTQHEKCGMAISSVQPDFRLMGQLTAQELAFLFKRPKYRGRPHEVLVSVKEVIARESTARSIPAAKLVEQALTFIHANCHRRLRRADVVAHLGCSLQLAELRFNQILGNSIHKAIEKVRLEAVAQRVKIPGVTVRQIAKEMDFTSANQLSRIYKRHFGRTITDDAQPPRKENESGTTQSHRRTLNAGGPVND